MNRLLVFLLISFAYAPVFSSKAQVPPPAFANRYGGQGSDYNRSVRTFPDGSTILIGEFSSSITLGTTLYTSQGGFDAFICKSDANGQVLWSTVLAGSGTEFITQTWIDASGQVYVVGQYNSEATFAGTALANSGGVDGMVAKLTTDGTVAWVKTASNEGDADYNELAVDASGQVYAFGTFTQTLTLGSTTLTAAGSGTFADLCLVKYDGQGNVVWAKRYGNGATEDALAIWVNDQGECTLTGTFLGSTSFGTVTHTSKGSSDIFIARMDTGGDPLWSQSYGGTGTDNTFALTGDFLGNVFLAGCFMESMEVGTTTLTSNGEWDVFTTKILSNGQPEWAVGFGGTQNDRCNDVLVAPTGHVYMYGWYQSSMTVGSETVTSLGGYDVFLIKLQPNGTPQWVYSFGGNSFDVGAGIDRDASESLYLSGDFWSPDFAVGNLTMAPVSGNDVFLIRLGSGQLETKPPVELYSPLWSRRLQNGHISVETRRSGTLHLVTLQGQTLYQGPIAEGEPVFLLHSGVVFYRFSHGSEVRSGKFIAGGE